MTTQFNYSKIKMKKTDRLNEIIKSTKNMIINSSKFNNYLNDYVSAIQVPTFKSPEINSYPILKNFYLIPLNKVHSSREEENSSRPFSCMKIQKDPKNTLPLPHLSNNKELLKKNSLFFKHDNDARKVCFRKKMMRVNSAANLKLGQNQPSLHRESSNFQRGCLINAFFPDWYFDNQIYDESEIFNKESYYKAFINNKMNYIKTNKIENTTCVVTNKFNEDTNREMTITLSSMRIEFKNKSDEKKKSKVIFLPFAYLFLFYFKGIEYFQHILLGIIKFNEDNDEIELDEQRLYEVLRSNPSLLLTQREYNTERRTITNISNNNLINRNDVREHGSTQKFPRKSPPRRINPLSHKAYNNYSFIWVAPENVYQICISLPEITIFVKKTQTKVLRYIDSEFILFLIEKNFVNWDFYVINFLFSLRDFRLFIEGMLSKNKYSAKSKSFNNDINSKLSLAKPNNVFQLSPTKAHDFSLIDYTLSYFFSSENKKNSLYVLHSYSVSIYFPKLHPLKEFTFDFTFKQMIILNKILIQTGNLEAFIMKILITDCSLGIIQLNYSFFDHFDENIFKDEKSLDIGDKSNKTNIKGIEITIDQPYLERIFPDSPYSNNDFLPIKITKEVITELDGKELTLWPKILMNNLELGNIRPEENSPQEVNIRAGSIRKGSKMNLLLANQNTGHFGSDSPIQKRNTFMLKNSNKSLLHLRKTNSKGFA